MKYKITCRDCPQVIVTSSKTRVLCDDCKKRLKAEYNNEYKSKGRMRCDKIVRKTKNIIMTDEDQNKINKAVDSAGITVDPGRIIKKGSPEFSSIAEQYINREHKSRVLYA